MLARRTVVGAGALLGLVASPAIAQSQPEVKWRLTSSFPKQLDIQFGVSLEIARMVSELTDKRFEIQCFSAGELVPGAAALDGVINGAVEAATTPMTFYVGKNAALALASGIPFGLNTRLQQAWLKFGGGGEFLNTLLARDNVIAFHSGNTGCQMGGFFRKEIRDLADLQGLKFRIAGLGGRVLARIGVVPQQIAPGDIYSALERGTIDAAEFIGPYDDERLGLHKVAPNYYYPGWWEGGAALHTVVGLNAWNTLPKAYQAALSAACEHANSWMVAKYDALNMPALRRLIAQGVQLRPFPQNVVDAGWRAAHELYQEIGATNADFKTGSESYLAFRNEQLIWWQVGEQSFDTIMARLRGR